MQSVDVIRNVTLPLLYHFGIDEGLDFKVPCHARPALSLCLILCDSLFQSGHLSYPLPHSCHSASVPALPDCLSCSVSPSASCTGTPTLALSLELCAAAHRVLQIKKRGSPPEGGGEVVFKCPTVKVPIAHSDHTLLVAECTGVETY